MKLFVLCLASQTYTFMISQPSETGTLELGGILAITQVSTEPQFSSNAGSCLEWRVGACPDFDQCLRDQLSMEKIDDINDNGNLLASEYVVGCQAGYSPNMEGQFQSSTVECAAKPSDPKFVGWNFKNSFDCVKTSVDIEFSQNKNGSPPPCNLDGVDWIQSENYVRKDATSSATWPILMDSNGAFIRTRVPVPASMAGASGFENGFIILVVYNLKLSDYVNTGETVRFTMYGQDFKHVATEEDAESTIVAFQSSMAPACMPNCADSFNIYYSIEGVNMDQTQHLDYEIGIVPGELYTEESYVTDLATCLLPLIDGTPATP